MVDSASVGALARGMGVGPGVDAEGDGGRLLTASRTREADGEEKEKHDSHSNHRVEALRGKRFNHRFHSLNGLGIGLAFEPVTVWGDPTRNDEQLPPGNLQEKEPQ